MDDCCPLCRKVGNYKKIRAIQVSYDEAVWLCEEENVSKRGRFDLKNCI